MKDILRVNVADATFRRESLTDEYICLGGRALIARILLKEVKASCDPLGQHNKLIFATGLLAGTRVSSSGRISIGAKSPLTGGIKESNGGGITATRLAQMMIRAVIIEGLPPDKTIKILHITNDGASLVPAPELTGVGIYRAADLLKEKYSDSAITLIGQSGEFCYANAGIATIDKDGNPTRFSGRGGLGAVMGAKGLKALVVTGRGKVDPIRREKYTIVVRDLNKAILDSQVAKTYKRFGTAALVEIVNEYNALPIRNFSIGKDKRAKNIGGDTMHDTILARGGEGRISHACMPGCVVSCSNVYVDKYGKEIVSPIEYENIGLLGSNLDIWDLDHIAQLNRRCNDLGIDTIETGAAIGVMMESGLLEFGDFDGAMSLLDEMDRGTLKGRLLGSGATTVGKVLGVRNVPAVKGQAMAAYDPRAIKGMGVTYATSAMGADHTTGPTTRAQGDHTDPSGKANQSKTIQKLLGVFDITGLCLFTVGGVATNKQMVLDTINSLYGWDYDMEWFDTLCVRMLEDERKFNELAGINNSHHRLPEAFTERKLPGIDSVFDVSDEDIASVFDYNS